MTDASPSIFTNQLLIALPALSDPNFARSVTLLCQHDAGGAMGVMVNRPSEYTLGQLFDQIDSAGDPDHGADDEHCRCDEEHHHPADDRQRHLRQPRLRQLVQPLGGEDEAAGPGEEQPPGLQRREALGLALIRRSGRGSGLRLVLRCLAHVRTSFFCSRRSARSCRVIQACWSTESVLFQLQ